MNLDAVPVPGVPESPHADRCTVRPLPLGVVVYEVGHEAGNILAWAADDLAASGYRLGGVVQSSVHRPGRRKCDMYLRDLSSGEEILISFDRGNGARGCRLDPAAFARAGLWGERALVEGVDLLILNKFGKQEAQGRGFRPLIADALPPTKTRSSPGAATLSGKNGIARKISNGRTICASTPLPALLSPMFGLKHRDRSPQEQAPD